MPAQTSKKKLKLPNNPLLLGIVNEHQELSDELGRRPFAKGIAQIISKSCTNECLVLGIEGAWGAGKSYLIELIRREIEEKRSSNKGIKWMVFNPWHFKNSDHLAELFLRELALYLEAEAGIKRQQWRLNIIKKLKPVRTIIKFILKYSFILKLLLAIFAGTILFFISFSNLILETFASNIANSALFMALIPSLLDLSKYLFSPKSLKQTEKNLASISNVLRDYADIIQDHENRLSTKTLDELKKEVTNKLSNSELPFSRIVVAVEDLDRLSPNEVRSMVQLMRMIADFPKIIYLVGYDRDHVINALGEMAGKGSTKEEAHTYGLGYLQKVVHAAYKLPKANDKAVINTLYSQYTSLVKGVYDENEINSAYCKKVLYALDGLVPSMRVGERLVNRALHIVTMLQDKSNPIDVLIAAYLMEFQGTLWDWLWNNRGAVLGGGRRFLHSGDETSTNPLYNQASNKDFVRAYLLGDKKTQDCVLDLLEMVLPSMMNDSPYPFSDMERTSFRMGIPEYFEIYFKYEQNAATDSPELAHSLITAKDNLARTKILQKVLAKGNEGLQYMVKDVLHYNNNNQLDWQTQALPLLEAMGKHSDNEDGAITVFLLAVDLVNSQPLEMRSIAIMDLITNWINCNVGYLPMRFFEKLAMEKGYIEYEPGMIKSDKPLQVDFKEHDYNLIRNRLCSVLNSWAAGHRTEKILEHKHAASIIFMWLRLDYNTAQQAVTKWINEDYQVIELLKSMMQVTYSYNQRDGVTVQHALSENSLKKLTGMDGDQIKDRVNQATNNTPFLLQKFPEVIKAVRNLPDKLSS